MDCKTFPILVYVLLTLLVICSGCSPGSENLPAITPQETIPQKPTATSLATITETPIPTPIRTPPALPEIFISDQLNPIDTPYVYVVDTCEYLKNRWDPNNAQPGTVVMLVMINNINRGDIPNSTDSITVSRFEHMMENVIEQGYEAINSQQLLDFLENNSYIPPRSILFLQEGRRTAGNYESHFRKAWEAYKWPVVNGWITQLDSTQSLLDENLALEQEGFVDHQLYSPLQRYRENASEEFLSAELTKHIDIFTERFEKPPVGISWPGKPGVNFINAARNMGFKLGFTQNTRGPVMYNWIPLAAYEDMDRPAYYPEDPYNDPLMTLPRYWATNVVESLDQVRLVGKGSVAYAKKHKDTELEYYEIVCAPKYGEIPEGQ